MSSGAPPYDNVPCCMCHVKRRSVYAQSFNLIARVDGHYSACKIVEGIAGLDLLVESCALDDSASPIFRDDVDEYLDAGEEAWGNLFVAAVNTSQAWRAGIEWREYVPALRIAVNAMRTYVDAHFSNRAHCYGK